MIFLIILLLLATCGRLACSKICPLGILEELIFRIPFPKKLTSLPGEKHLLKIKYVIFASLIVLVPLVFMPNKESWHGIFLFVKLFGFTTVFLLSIFIYRPFCKYFCPFGIFLGFFNKISPYRYEVTSDCNKCGLCKIKCKMGIIPYENPNSIECIRCGECLSKCNRSGIRRK